MSDSDSQGGQVMPLNQNINIIQLVGAVAAIAGAFGSHWLTPELQAAIVTIIVAGMAAATWYTHTFVNHPRNVARMETAIRAAQAPVICGAAQSQSQLRSTFGTDR